jgi:hypothetical protein
MANAEWGAVEPPNEGEFKGYSRANGFLPLTEAQGNVHPSNERLRDRHTGGSSGLVREPSLVAPLNRPGPPVGTSGTVQVPSAVEPGKGMVPVNPFLVRGGFVPAERIGDEAPDVYRRR